MQIWSRRQIETIVLALLGIAAVVPFRFFAEPRPWFLSEMASIGFFSVLVVGLRGWGGAFQNARKATALAVALLCVTPIVFAVAGRAYGAPVPFEMTALTTCSAVSLGMAVVGATRRILSLSLVISGFLVLFCAAISDNQNAVSLPLLWMLICVWHLVANRWERLDLAMPESVERTWSLRPQIIVVALVVLAAGAYAIRNRAPASERFDFGFMPTSGGSRWSDPAARSGVGTGLDAIAAKDHAESFGAVDSDIFLESNESTLFDMFNDSLGPPKKKKNVWERRQGMNNENLIPMHEKAARTDQGSGSFSTDRLPAKKHTHAESVLSNDVLQWDGPTGIRLALQRYDTFDGHDWSQSGDLSCSTLSRIDINDASWFFDPRKRASFLREPDSVSVGLLKVIGLDSQRIPTPMLTAGIHIKAIDRQDFFAINEDGSFYMPGREKVPPLTIVHIAHARLMEDDLREHLKPNTEASLPSVIGLGETAAAQIDDLVQLATKQHSDPTDQLSSCVDLLRAMFSFQRSGVESAGSLEEFLQSRRGGDHLFATLAALMARRLGFESRLVTGFYVRPGAYEITAGHACVLPQDVHAWTEVKLDDGRWFEIEPTPGYLQPQYQPSWNLVAKQMVVAYWPAMLATSFSLIFVYLGRRYWIDWVLTAAWCFSGWLRPRQRIRLGCSIIEARARLAGAARPAGKSQRAWLEELVGSDLQVVGAVKRFGDSADLLFFGHGAEFAHQDSLQLVRLLRVRTIMSFNHKATP